MKSNCANPATYRGPGPGHLHDQPSETDYGGARVSAAPSRSRVDTLRAEALFALRQQVIATTETPDAWNTDTLLQALRRNFERFTPANFAVSEELLRLIESLASPEFDHGDPQANTARSAPSNRSSRPNWRHCAPASPRSRAPARTRTPPSSRRSVPTRRLDRLRLHASRQARRLERTRLTRRDAHGLERGAIKADATE